MYLLCWLTSRRNTGGKSQVTPRLSPTEGMDYVLPQVNLSATQRMDQATPDPTSSCAVFDPMIVDSVVDDSQVTPRPHHPGQHPPSNAEVATLPDTDTNGSFRDQ